MNLSNFNSPDPSGRAVRSVEVCQLFGDPQKSPQRFSDRIIAEQAVTVMVDQVGSFTIMCTPVDLKALALGFIFAEGMIDDLDDVTDLIINPATPDVVGVRIQDPSRIATGRNLVIASSCGMCGVRNLEKLLADMPVCGESLKIPSPLLFKLTEQLRVGQQIFQATGSAHAAAIFDAAGGIIAFAEDIGRHAALDKAIGKCLLARQPTKGCGVVLSGRLSLEMVTKSARAGIEIIAAVSAPSSFAVEAAQQWNITLCGFVRLERANVYTHSQRITDLHLDCGP